LNSLDDLNGRVASSREMALGWSRTRLGMVRDRPPPAARDAFQLSLHCGFAGRKSDMLRYRETDGRRGSADFGFAQGQTGQKGHNNAETLHFRYELPRKHQELSYSRLNFANSFQPDGMSKSQLRQ